MDLQTGARKILVRGGNHAHYVPSGLGSPKRAERGKVGSKTSMSTTRSTTIRLPLGSTSDTVTPSVPVKALEMICDRVEAMVQESPDREVPTVQIGEFLMERRDVYPNGIAFDAQGRLYWTESAAHRVCRLDDGQATTFCQLSDGHVPDGMAFAADGRLFAATTISGGVTVISPDGEVLTASNHNLDGYWEQPDAFNQAVLAFLARV